MSKILINQYYQNFDRTLQFDKSKNEQSIRTHFLNLLNEYAHKLNYEVIAEIAVMGTKGKKVIPDGTVKNLWGLDIGLWESKDEKDDIEAEIEAKIKKGYPLLNTLFDDSNIAILYQRGEKICKIDVRDADKLHQLLTDFFEFKSENVYKFEDAIEKFKADIPIIVETLRNTIVENRTKNLNFIAVQDTFLELCKAEINPSISLDDIREMMIQHILTSDIFNKIFDDSDFHHHNTIASELEKLTGTLFSYAERRNLLFSIEHYYEAINATAAGITDHHEKQKFLKVLYENFYKVYNPKAADRLGVVYTPNEIVQFMVKSTNYLLHKHFGLTMADKNVEILDPATGTGTFICEIIENAIPKQNLEYKFKNEIHANEVAILPYYIANLNIEYTFKQKMQFYAEFPNLCFVDTLDNTTGLKFEGKQNNLFGLSSENTERIKRQNSKKISVVIGNPPYNANQANFNDFNQNRIYNLIDKRIKETYVKYSTATNKANLYDMYTRFYRWASDRLDKNGVLTFITNNSFVNNKAFDGFRKCIQEEFDYAYIIDLGGNIRELSGKDGIWMNEKHTIFGKAAAVGIAMMILIKKETKEKTQCRIEYLHPCDIRATRLEKLDWLRHNPIENIYFESIRPDKNNNWINITDNDFEKFPNLIHNDVKNGKSKEAIFELFSLGVASHRDEWVYDFEKINLKNKISFFINIYNETVNDENFIDKKRISWDRELNNYKRRKIFKKFESESVLKTLFRPFVSKYHYFDKHFNGMLYQWSNIHNSQNSNYVIAINKEGNAKGLHCLVSNNVFDLHTTGDSQCLPLYRFDKQGNRVDNITDWGLSQFVNHYSDEKITKEDIFHYTYAVLHNPNYRKKYELNLKREFPRLPFYTDFWKWANFGKQLMNLHINYESVEPFNLQVITSEIEGNAKHFSVEEPQAIYGRKPKGNPKLKADKTTGIIEIDEFTIIKGIPSLVWEYKLGNRSAIEWILDQYKERKPIDPTIAEKFNTYCFANYKEQVIDLIKRVCTVSVETVNILNEMKNEN